MTAVPYASFGSCRRSKAAQFICPISSLKVAFKSYNLFRVTTLLTV